MERVTTGCPYLEKGINPNMTAPQWNELLRKTLDQMDTRAAQLPTEKLIKLLQSMIHR